MLTQTEQNDLRRRTGWSDEIVGSIRSMAEAEIYIGAGLKEARVGSRPALIRSDIDFETAMGLCFRNSCSALYDARYSLQVHRQTRFFGLLQSALQ